MKKLIFIFIIAVLSFYNSCKEDKADNNTPPKIFSLNPAIGMVDDEISLLGAVFGTVASDVRVTFSDYLGTEYDAQIIDVTNNEIRIVVPDYGTKPDGVKFFVHAYVQGFKSNVVQFAIETPPVIIESLYPATGMVGDEIKLVGKGFGKVASNVRVVFSEGQDNSHNAQVISVTNEEIRIIVPDFGSKPDETSFSVSVYVRDAQSNVCNFTVNGPAITSLNKNTGVFDDEIIITGVSFSSIANNNEVFFKGATTLNAEIVEASPTSLKVIAPRLYQENLEIYVVRKSQQSNSVPFTYNLFGCDSVTIVTADWTIETLRADVVWKKGTFRVFGSDSRRDVNVLEITPGAGGVDTQLGIADRENGRTAQTSAYGSEFNALAVINGGYFSSTHEPYTCDYLRINNQVKATGRTNEDVHPVYTYVDMCMAFSKLTSGGYEASFLQLNTSDNNRNPVASHNFAEGITPPRSAGAYEYAITAGPWLVSNGTRRTSFLTSDHWTTSRPRAGVGIAANEKILFVTIDGDASAAGAAGVTIDQQSRIMKALGCTAAISLDGGGSTTMWIQGKGVVSDVFGDGSQRAVANVIYVK